MAYNELGMRVGGAGHDAAQIVAGLAFGGHINADEVVPEFRRIVVEVFDALTDLEVAKGGSAPQAAPSQPAPPPGGNVKVLGKQHGDIPEWMNAAAAEVLAKDPSLRPPLRVFDNRKDQQGNDQTGTKRPHFATPKDARFGPQDMGFWPPK